jgi:hypothetical protein
MAGGLQLFQTHETLGFVPPVEYKKSVSLELLKTGKL